MQEKNSKIILGLISLLAFFSIIYFSSSIFGGRSVPSFQMPDDISKYLTRSYWAAVIAGDNKNYSSNSLRTREVVQEESSVIDVVDSVSPSVVSIIVKSASFDIFSGPTVSEEGIGTGFIVSDNGLIVTNSHVVDDPSGQYSVVLKDGTTYEVENINLDETSDLAILEISARNLPVAEFGDSSNLKVGQQAIAIGNALGRFQNTVTTGVISGIARGLSASGGFGTATKVYDDVIQTDAALNPGNSGGPLLNSAGQVIGINVATTMGADNISFAIPVNKLKPILESFIKEGRIIKPYMGISYRIITKEIATLRDLPEGAFVSAVLPDSPASKAGIKRGDIILTFNGEDVVGDYALANKVSSMKVGDRVELSLDRDGDVLDIDIILEELPNTTR